MKNKTSSPATQAAELKVGDLVHYILPQKFGGQTVKAEIKTISAAGLHLKLMEPAMEVGPVTHHPALAQVKHKRANTWHTLAEGEELASALKAQAEAEAKAKAEAETKAKE